MVSKQEFCVQIPVTSFLPQLININFYLLDLLQIFKLTSEEECLNAP